MIIHKINEKINLKIRSIISKDDLSMCAKGILICIINGENTGKIYSEEDFCRLLSLSSENIYTHFDDFPKDQLDALNELLVRKYILRYSSINKRNYIKVI